MLGQTNKKEPPFRVPEDYFRELNGKIMSSLPNKEDSLMEMVDKGNPFGVPENYFGEFNSRIMSVLPEEGKALLEIIGNENPFSVPEDYFVELNAHIMEALPQKGKKLEKKVKPIWKRITPLVAVAAVFAGILITTGFWDISPKSIEIVDSIEGTTIIYDEAEEFYLFLSDEVASTAIYNESF